jgi:hypothetical protein
MTSKAITRKYRMEQWGITYVLTHNDGERMIFIDHFTDGWTYGILSHEEVDAEIERHDGSCGVWRQVANGGSGGYYPTRREAIQAALADDATKEAKAS